MAERDERVSAPLSPPTTYRGDIEGLRAVAVLLVLAVHAGLPLAGGFVGVDVFFALSGFLITSLLVEELVRTRRVSLAGFYARRARRLLPAVAVVLLATAVLTVTLLPRARWRGTGFDILASATYVENWRLAALSVDYQALAGPVSPLQHFWSLGVEEQFYLLWPLLLVLIGVLVRRSRFKTRSMRKGSPALRQQTFRRLLALMVLVAAASFAWSVFYTHRNQSGAYFVTTTRLWELAVGGVLALLAPRLLGTPRGLAAVIGWAGLAAILASALRYDAGTPFPGYLAALPVMGTLGVIAAGLSEGAPGPRLLLDLPPLRWIGRLSYSLYLWHWPLLVVAAVRFGALSQTEGLAVVAASVVPAYLSFRFVEDPIHHAAYFQRRTVRSLDVGIVATASSVAVALAFLAVSPPAPPVVPITVAVAGKPDPQQPKVGAQVLRADPRDDPAGAPRRTVRSIYPPPEQAPNDLGIGFCPSPVLGTTVESCSGGDVDSTTTVALVGDSHAQQWTTPMYTIGTARKWKVTAYTKSTCPLVDSETAIAVDAQGNYTAQHAYPQCFQWARRMIAKLTGPQHPDMVVLSWVQHYLWADGSSIGGQEGLDQMRDGEAAVMRKLIAAGVRVVVLADTPAPKTSIPECVQAHLKDLLRCTTARSSARQDDATIVQAARAVGSKVTLIDMTYAVCPTARCAPVIGGVMVWRDQGHLTASYAATLAPRLNKLLPNP